MIVDDVTAVPRYLSCLVKTRSKIIVPISVPGAIVGEINVDSHEPAAFTDADGIFLEEAARIVGNYLERHSIRK